MKTKEQVLNANTAITHWKWMGPTVITAALLVALLGLTGCPGPCH